MANDEPRALGAALSGPAFTTRMGGAALHAANRHVERWAPEAGAERVRSMRSLGFVDRLVSPWIETAQRSAGLRMFSSMQRAGAPEREGAPVSWVFPRPWYQDELDWMAASRQTAQQQQESGASPSMFTTRGTYVSSSGSSTIAPQVRPTASTSVMPSALYEFVAPSLSVAPPQRQNPFNQPAGVGFGGSDAVRQQAYSSLVPLAAVQAAELMQRTIAPLATAGQGQMPTALRNVLSTMLARTAVSSEPTRASQFAPELVTPPAPRREDVSSSAASPSGQTESYGEAERVADTLHEQRAQIAQLEVVAQRAAQREVDQRRAVEVQQRAQQVETQLRERAERVARAEAVSSPSASSTPADRTAERARVEERIAQRIAERTAVEQRVAQQQVAQQRLHEQSRSEAAAHVRSEPAPAPVLPIDAAPAAESASRRAPAEVIAAIAALPPELQSVIARSVTSATRPEQAAQAIAQVTEALRAAELMARTTAANHSFEATRGPRVMLPAGLGGLVSTVDHTSSPTQMAAMFGGPQAPAYISATPTAPRTMLRAPSIANVFVAPTAAAANAQSRGMAPAATTALGAAAQSNPAALGHVAWADRWLARFAGAAPKSLDTFDAAAQTTASTMSFLANAAPDAVFVAPTFDIERTRTQSIGADAQAIAATPAPLQRFDDSQETPDDVFLAISAGASRRRAAVSPQRPVAEPTVGMPAGERPTLADAVAMHAPSSPDAGLSAQLASSPFAPALRHVLPLPAAATFDVRALFGSGLSATYLAGLLAQSAHEINLSIGERSFAPMIGQSFAPASGLIGERSAPELDLAYVAPTDDREQSVASSSDGESASSPGSSSSSSPAAAAYEQPLTTLRTALLSWTQDVPSAQTATAATAALDTPAAPISSSAARVMLESMSMPMVADTAPTANGAWTAPGMIAERAFGWSLAQERNASDLSLDFVTPELVLAARVYGLGPADAAQASRLALAGPGQLTAMAGAVDRTFVQAMAIENERTRLATAYPLSATSSATASGDVATAPSSSQSSAAPSSTPAFGEVRQAPAQTAFGVERRSPRGAFLWPSATVAALGLSAPGPDSEQSMSVAALELLAAQAVAEIGTYAALQPRDGQATRADEATSSIDGPQTTSGSLSTGATGAAGSNGSNAATASSPERSLAEPAEADVLGAAAALVPASRRARFDALYVALGQSGSGRSWSPAARAARALALAGRGEEGTVSAYERAASAWDVLPVVYATEGLSTEEVAEQTRAGVGSASGAGYSSASASASARSASRAPSARDVVTVDGRPGLAHLSARAGDALGSYVAPISMASMSTPSASASSASTREAPVPVSQRAASAAPEFVQTGRPSGRHGGGEAEIPAWFEAAARKMLGERTGNSDGISMAELTLISTAPKQAIAASGTGNSGHAPAPTQASPGAGEQKDKDDQKINIEEVAVEIYRQVLLMFDAARERNGEPYL